MKNYSTATSISTPQPFHWSLIHWYDNYYLWYTSRDISVKPHHTAILISPLFCCCINIHTTPYLNLHFNTPTAIIPVTQKKLSEMYHYYFCSEPYGYLHCTSPQITSKQPNHWPCINHWPTTRATIVLFLHCCFTTTLSPMTHDYVTIPIFIL